MSLIGLLHGKYVFERRTVVIARQLSRLLPRCAHVVDIGCGDGTMAVRLRELRPDVTLQGVDVMARPGAKIPVQIVDGERLPFPDQSFDAAMMIDVLHHTHEPIALLREAARVAKECVVVKDHLADGRTSHLVLRFMDWVGNARHGVELPYNYFTEAQWREAFRAIAWLPDRWHENLGLYRFPASLAFDRNLHFVARLVPGPTASQRRE